MFTDWPWRLTWRSLDQFWIRMLSSSDRPIDILQFALKEELSACASIMFLYRQRILSFHFALHAVAEIQRVEHRVYGRLQTREWNLRFAKNRRKGVWFRLVFACYAFSKKKKGRRGGGWGGRVTSNSLPFDVCRTTLTRCEISLIIFSNNNGELKGAVTLCNFSCNLSRFDDHMRLKEHFHRLVPQTVATQVAGQMLHCAMLKKFVVTVAESRTQLDFPQRFLQLVSHRLQWAMIRATCLAMTFLDKLHEKLHSITAHDVFEPNSQ